MKKVQYKLFQVIPKRALNPDSLLSASDVSSNVASKETLYTISSTTLAEVSFYIYTFIYI